MKCLDRYVLWRVCIHSAERERGEKRFCLSHHLDSPRYEWDSVLIFLVAAYLRQTRNLTGTKLKVYISPETTIFHCSYKHNFPRRAHCDLNMYVRPSYFARAYIFLPLFLYTFATLFSRYHQLTHLAQQYYYLHKLYVHTNSPHLRKSPR